MTINLFVGGSGANFKDPSGNLMQDAFRNEFNHWGIDNRDYVDCIEVQKNGTAQYVQRGSHKNIVITFKNCIYIESELENIGFGLKNAMDLVRRDNGYPFINLFGHSNGGNAIARYLYNFKPNFIENILTCATPYNGKALTVTSSPFLKEVSDLTSYFKPSGNVDMFVGKGNISAEFGNIPNDGVISTDSGQCGRWVYNHYVNVIEGANHGTINTIPEVTKIVNEWQV
ncbi:alpha/beta hydrolase [Companilactobacillus zhongbaensis]|uniref:alpha/beta hydrolase n=1 Tax=Companilactobacillus zhongbaensis TaxID=2486009 RepID=UPI000F771FD2|nr:alpha/beta hydrolase [Companilactobacillus zhongbaensis]